MNYHNEMEYEDPPIDGRLQEMILSEPLSVRIERGRGSRRWVAHLSTGPFPISAVHSLTHKRLLAKIEQAIVAYYKALRFY